MVRGVRDTAPPAANAAGPERIAVRLHADDANAGLERREPPCDRGDEAATARRNEHAIDVGAVRQDLGHDRGVAGDDRVVGERVDEHLGVRLPRTGRDPFVQPFARQQHRRGAEGADSLELERRRRIGHHDPARNLQLVGHVGARERRVARADGQETAGGTVAVERQGRCKEAAHLEAAGRLQRLELDPAAAGARDQRRVPDVRRDPPPGVLDLLGLEPLEPGHRSMAVPAPEATAAS